MASTTAMRITKSSLSSYKSRTEIKHSENVNHLTQSAHKETEASRHVLPVRPSVAKEHVFHDSAKYLFKHG